MSCFLLVIIVVVYGVVSGFTYVAYGVDKRAARRAKGRVPERTLHLMELGCGWPGAMLAQRHFKHKRRKAEYMLAFRLIVAVHVLFWGMAVLIWWELP